MNIKFYKYLIISFLIILLPLFTTCDMPLGLGVVISTKGPTLSITGPVPVNNQNDIQVSNLFVLAGTTNGPAAAARMEIQLTRFDTISNTLVVLGREWQYNNGWKWKEDSGYPVQTYNEASYSSAGNISNINGPSWTVSGNDVTWSLPVNLHGYPKGDIFISIRTWDAAGNTDSDSVQKIKVIYDNNEPYLVITQMNNILYPGSGPQMNPAPPEVFSTYVYNPLNEWTASYDFLNKWINETLEFGWAIDKEIIGDYKLVIEITNSHDLNTGAGKELYYRYVWSGSKLPRYGMFTNGTAPVGYEKVGSGISVSELVPRDLLTGQKNGSTLNKNNYTPMMIVAWLEDGNGIEDSVPSKGYFPLWEKTNEPFAHIAFGHKENPAVTTPQGAPELAVIWSVQTNHEIICYDNTGVKSLSWKLDKLVELDDDSEPNKLTIKSQVGSGTVDLKQTLPSVHYLKSVTTTLQIASHGVGRYKLSVEVTDINNIAGDEYSVYFSVESYTTPTVKEISSPSDKDSLFGNEQGNFKVSGTVQIEDQHDNLSIEKVSIAWIYPGDRYIEDTLLYLDPYYSNWSSNNSPGKNYFQDSIGNRVWQTSPIYKKNTGDMKEYSFEKELNIFNDFAIFKSWEKDHPLGGAHRILIRSYGSNKRASVTSLDIPGDITPPKIEITQIIVSNRNDPYEKLEQSGFGMISTINKNDTIQLKGTWSDDSLAWRGHPGIILEDYFHNFSVKWKGEKLIIEPMSNLNAFHGFNNGTYQWETGVYTFTDNNEDAIVTLTAEITDYNGNKGSEEITIILETDNPTLVRITSDTGDGEYGENKDTDPIQNGVQRYIDIFLEFNKPVQFFPEAGNLPQNPSSNVPYLALSNGGKAFYFKGNGDTRFGFRYFIDGNVPSNAADPSYLGYYPSSANLTGNEGSSSNGRLNVNQITWQGQYNANNCVSADGGTIAHISNNLFSPSNSYSLAGGKNIVIDKTPPVISSIVTTASHLRPHGLGSPIYITVNFNETVQIPSAANANNFYINLSGTGQTPVARFDSVTGAASVTFLYEVTSGQNTTAGQNLGISSIYLSGFQIKDNAENVLSVTSNNVTLPAGGNVLKNLNGEQLVIDTAAPNSPAIGGLTANTNYYSDIKFNITGLESPDVSVDYCLNYNSASPASAVWTNVSSSVYQVKGSAGNYYIENIPVSINGTYNIAARQRDNATTPNVSAAGSVLANVKVDKGTIFTRLGSNKPDGIYGKGEKIEIDMVFRIPVYLDTIPNTNAYLTMNSGVSSNTAKLVRKSTDSKTYTFEFETKEGDLAERLDVKDFTFTGLNFYDKPAGELNRTVVNEFITLPAVSQGAYLLPKQITILTGYPIAQSITAGSGEIRITFDRDIYRGDVTEKLQIKQAATGYRLPAVITEDRFTELFIGRNDIPVFNETAWRNLGNELYQRGTNGATGTGTNLSPETVIKYVLKYEVDAGDSVTGNVSGISTTVTRQNLLNAFRAAEALSFNALDKEVKIENMKTLVISLAQPKALPVKGAVYQWTIPNGFIKDFLENPNGGSKIGYDEALTSGNADNSAHDNNTNAIRVTGLENPVIRINKGLTETIAGTGNARQARQPLTSNFQIDSRTPNTTTRYRTRQTTDNVGRLVMRRNGNTAMTNASLTTGTGLNVISYNLPNLGAQTANQNGKDTFANSKRRPQSGNATDTYWNPTTEAFQNAAGTTGYTNGLNLWTPMAAWSTTTHPWNNYTTGSQVSIGTNNYNDGGLIILIQAQAAIISAPQTWTTVSEAFEAAYRSVFVFNNANLNGNGNNININNRLQTTNSGAPFANENLARIYIRGGDTTSGDPSVPDFPVARDRSLSKKTRLLTPVARDVFRSNNADMSVENATAANINQTTDNANLFGNTNAAAYVNTGQYLWFWVTWGVNIPCYVDVFSGQMADTGSHHVFTKDFYATWTYSKEHYAVLPGRTTVVESRAAYGTQSDGGHGEQIYVGPVVQTPAPSDLN